MSSKHTPLNKADDIATPPTQPSSDTLMLTSGGAKVVTSYQPVGIGHAEMQSYSHPASRVFS